ncbi:MAG: acetate--CoA ligase family protein [Rhodanobacter sp.]
MAFEEQVSGAINVLSSRVLTRLLAPRSIAVVGASSERGAVGGLVLSNLERFGYGGSVHLVSRTRDEINGVACVKTIDELPEGIDAAILAIPQAGVQDSIEACIRRSIGGAVVFASGYSEMGERGAAAQALLTATACANNFALLGPNCMGLVNFSAGVPLTFEPLQPHVCGSMRRIGIVTQSGAMAGNLRQAFLSKGLQVAFAGSTGNEAVLGAEDLVGHLIDSDAVDVVAIFVEMIRKPQVFLETAVRARAAGKPIVLMHPGRSVKAREAAQSHTGALAGDYELMRTLVEREAAIVVPSLDELFDTVAILARYPAPVKGGAVVASNSGAIRGISLDACEEMGLEFAVLNEVTVTAIKAVLPDFATVDNPLDLTSQGMQRPEIFGQTAQAILADANVGSFVVPLMGGSPKQQADKARSLLPALAGTEKPVVFVIMGDEAPLGEEFLALVRESGVPFLRSPDRALRAMTHVHRRGELVAAAQVRAPHAAVDIDTLVPAGPMAEYKGKAVLQAMGIAIPAGGIAHSVDEAIAVAARIGYPVVVKAQADALTHKSDVGGVAVGLRDEGALRVAWATMQARVAHACPEIVLDGLLVEAMASPGLELVIGARRDADWGLVMLVGLGGIWIEVLKDVRLLAADIDEAQIILELRKLKGAKLLDGVRGSAAVDLASVARVVRRLSDLMVAQPTIAEVDINPLVVHEVGSHAVALDVLIVGGVATGGAG